MIYSYLTHFAPVEPLIVYYIGYNSQLSDNPTTNAELEL